MVELKSKELERLELNRAIDAFIADGGTIKKLKVADDPGTENSGLSVDKFDPYMEVDDPDSDAFTRMIGRNNIDY